MSCIRETSTALNMRFNNHETHIRKQKSDKEEQEIEITHFENHGIDNVTILILDIFLNNKKD